MGEFLMVEFFGALSVSLSLSFRVRKTVKFGTHLETEQRRRKGQKEKKVVEKNTLSLPGRKNCRG